MRKRGFRAKSRFRSRGPRYEVSQVSLIQSANVTSDFTRNDPLQLSFPLLSQWGTITTNLGPSSTRQAVIDASVRGISIKSVYYDFNVILTPSLEASIATARFGIEVADCLFVDHISTNSTGGQDSTTFDPDLVPNLYANQVGAQVFEAGDVTGAGGFADIFAFPDRILYRRWGTLEGTQILVTGNTVLDSENLVNAQIASLKFQAPIDYAAKRIKRRAFLKDDQGLFCGINMVGHNPDPIDVAVQCNAVIVYRTVR